jgi:hypothetical protein
MIEVTDEVRYARSGELNIAYRVVGEGPLDLVWVPNWLSTSTSGARSRDLRASSTGSLRLRG